MGWWREDRDPRRHSTAERRREKLCLHLSQFMILLYSLLCLSAINPLVHYIGCGAQTPSCWKNEGREWSISDPFIVGSSFLKFISMVALGKGGIVIAQCKWVKNPDSLPHDIPLSKIWQWSHCAGSRESHPENSSGHVLQWIFDHRHSEIGVAQGANHISNTEHHGMHLYEGWIHDQQSEG